MAGLTPEGLDIKRLGDVITDMKAQAVPIFQDLVPPGDTVDTGDSTTIGRLIGLTSPSIADLWEVAMSLYWAFDPNASSGIALDNLVMYAGLVRNPPSPTTANVIVWGNETTQIGTEAQVRSTDNNLYNVSTPIILDRASSSGVELSLASVVVGQSYGVTITTSASTINISVTAVGGDTVATILDKIATAVAPYTAFDTEITDNNRIRIVTDDYLEYVGFSPINTVIQKVRTRMEVSADVPGSQVQEANTITTIATPILGWDSVNNPFPADIGEDLETDEELRIRFRDSKYVRAQNISDSLYSHILAINGLISAAIFENETDVYDPVYDLPPHSFKVVAQGGSPSDIAREIWKNKPLGIASIGNSSEIVVDSQGFNRTVRFDRPVATPVYITMNLTITDGELWPADGLDQIRANLIQYFQNNFSIGSPVIYSRLYTPINKVPGHQVNSLTIGTSPSPTGTSNINVPYNGLATLNTSDIIITVT